MTARTNVPLSTLTANGLIAIPPGTPIDQGNGMNVAFPSTTLPSAPQADRLVLLVITTNGADKAVTIKAGVLPPALRKDLGDLVVTATAAAGGGVIGPLETARFVQSNGSINIDFASGITGLITAFVLPHII